VVALYSPPFRHCFQRFLVRGLSIDVHLRHPVRRDARRFFAFCLRPSLPLLSTDRGPTISPLLDGKLFSRAAGRLAKAFPPPFESDVSSPPRAGMCDKSNCMAALFPSSPRKNLSFFFLSGKAISDVSPLLWLVFYLALVVR